MIVVYTPKGGEPQHYDASTLRVSEASIVQRTVDMKWQEILEGLERDDLDAMRGIVWVIRKRKEPSLRFGEFDPGVTEMTSRMDTREVEAWIENAFRVADTDEGVTQEAVVDILLSRLPEVAADPEHARAAIEARLKAPKDQPEQQLEVTQVDDSSPTPTSSTPDTSTSDSSPMSSTSLPETSTG